MLELLDKVVDEMVDETIIEILLTEMGVTSSGLVNQSAQYNHLGQEF